jgi:2',3'-cyclic-nucleotide 2'-phosphodiesterase (5'-nucleotidase family)
VDGIDAIVGGDSHTFLYQPVWVKSPSGRRVPIAQDGEYGGNVGKLELKFVRGKDGYRLSDARGELVPVSADIPEASDVRRALEPYVRPYLTKIGRLDRVGATPDERRQVTTRIVVEAIRKATGAEMALNPAGQGLIDVFHHAVVTRYDLYQAMPFHNVAVTVQLTGPEIEQILARYPSAVTSGMPSRLEGGRTYRVAMVDFVAREVCPAPTLRIVQTGPDVRKAVENYFRAGVDSYTSSATPGLSVISTLRPRSMSSEPRAVLTALPDRSRTR